MDNESTSADCKYIRITAKHTTADSQETNINQGVHLYFVLKLPQTNKTTENITQAVTSGSLVLTIPAQFRAG